MDYLARDKQRKQEKNAKFALIIKQSEIPDNKCEAIIVSQFSDNFGGVALNALGQNKLADFMRF